MNIELTPAEAVLLYRARAARARYEAEGLAVSSPTLAGVKSAYALQCEDLADITSLMHFVTGVWNGKHAAFTEAQSMAMWSLYERTGEVEPCLYWITHGSFAMSSCCHAELAPEGGRTWRGPDISGYYCRQCGQHCTRIFDMEPPLPIRWPCAERTDEVM